MAQTEHLPIYKASYDLRPHLEEVVAKFGRAHRYGLGAELREGARRVLRLVVRERTVGEGAVLLELRRWWSSGQCCAASVLTRRRWKPASRLPWPPGRL
jgi:hypothetical protein